MTASTNTVSNVLLYFCCRRSCVLWDRSADFRATVRLSWGIGVDDPSDACGHDSDCINRLTQVECLSDDCRCRSHCQNQR